MKMAAAEGLYTTQTHAPFSILTVGSLNGEKHTRDHRDPRPALLPRHRQLQRRDQGHRRPARRVQGALRPGPRRGLLLAGQLHADHPGRPTGPSGFMIGLGLLCGGCGTRPPLRHPAGPRPDQRVVGAAGDPAAPAAARRQLVRLDLHRDGSAALGGVRGHDDRERRLPERRRRARRHLADHLHPAVRRAGVIEVRLMLKAIKAGPARRPAGTVRRRGRRRPPSRLRVLGDCLWSSPPSGSP